MEGRAVNPRGTGGIFISEPETDAGNDQMLCSFIEF
jgi:hypothetical protein